MTLVGRFGAYPGGYVPFRTFASSSARDEPLTGGPTGPGCAGSLLWHAMQWAR